MLFKSNYIRIAWQSDRAEATAGAMSHTVGRPRIRIRHKAGACSIALGNRRILLGRVGKKVYAITVNPKLLAWVGFLAISLP